MVDKEFESRNEPAPVGLVRLVRELGLSVPLPKVRSGVVAGARRTRITESAVLEHYPRSYAPADLVGHLKFAMRYEPMDLGILYAVFQSFERKILESWVRAPRF